MIGGWGSLVLLAAQTLLGVCVAAFWFYSLLAVVAARQWHRARPAPLPDYTPAVTLLKPVRGVDAEAYANFASFCALDYPPERVQILFGALDPADPALALVRRLQTDFPQADIGLITPPPDAVIGYNRKVSNLAAMRPHAKHDLLVLCDSDMRVQPDYLRRVVAPFAAGAGLVTCPYRGFQAESFAAVLESLGIGSEFIPSALVSRILEGVGFAFGSTIALTREALDALGGFESLKDELADDFRLGNGARRAGFEVVLSDYVVDDVLGAERFGAMWARRLRWARTVRSCRPAGYAGAIITHGLVFALLFLLANGFRLPGWTLFGLTLAVRLMTAVWIAARYTRDSNVTRRWYLLPLSDLLSFALYVGSYLGNTIVWRGERFRLRPGGRLASARPTNPTF